MRVKDTLNIGKTKFPMRGRLPETEAQREKLWEDNKVYEQRQKLNQGKPTFILHDGPPYANGNIHIGHAMRLYCSLQVDGWFSGTICTRLGYARSAD